MPDRPEEQHRTTPPRANHDDDNRQGTTTGDDATPRRHDDVEAPLSPRIVRLEYTVSQLRDKLRAREAELLRDIAMRADLVAERRQELDAQRTLRTRLTRLQSRHDGLLAINDEMTRSYVLLVRRGRTVLEECARLRSRNQQLEARVVAGDEVAGDNHDCEDSENEEGEENAADNGSGEETFGDAKQAEEKTNYAPSQSEDSSSGESITTTVPPSKKQKINDARENDKYTYKCRHCAWEMIFHEDLNPPVDESTGLVSDAVPWPIRLDKRRLDLRRHMRRVHPDIDETIYPVGVIKPAQADGPPRVYQCRFCQWQIVARADHVVPLDPDTGRITDAIRWGRPHANLLNTVRRHMRTQHATECPVERWPPGFAMAVQPPTPLGRSDASASSKVPPLTKPIIGKKDDALFAATAVGYNARHHQQPEPSLPMPVVAQPPTPLGRSDGSALSKTPPLTKPIIGKKDDAQFAAKAVTGTAPHKAAVRADLFICPFCTWTIPVARHLHAPYDASMNKSTWPLRLRGIRESIQEHLQFEHAEVPMNEWPAAFQTKTPTQGNQPVTTTMTTSTSKIETTADHEKGGASKTPVFYMGQPRGGTVDDEESNSSSDDDSGSSADSDGNSSDEQESDDFDEVVI